MKPQTPAPRITLPALALCLCGICLCAAATTLHAQATRQKATGAKLGATPPPAPAPAPAPAERPAPSKAAATIAAGFKYQPPPPPKQDDDETDLRDTDKPKNEIIRLPTYVVTAKKPPVFTDRDLYPQEHLKKLAVTRHLSKLDTRLLNKWTIPYFGISNEQRALEIYYEEERLQNMAATREQISLLRTVDEPERADQMQEDYYDMFLRRRDTPRPETLTRQQGK